MRTRTNSREKGEEYDVDDDFVIANTQFDHVRERRANE